MESHQHKSVHAHYHGARNRSGNQRALAWAFGITSLIMVVEAVGGWLTNSLALMADAGHMVSDAASLGLSLLAIRFASRPASLSKSYGYRRLEILAALVNGLTLLAIAVFIIWEAGHRLLAPPVVSSLPMMGIALVGLLANLASALILLNQGDVRHNLNLRSAYLHVMGDALGSVGALLAGALMYYYNWYLADPLVSLAVAALILRGAWLVVSQSLHILMEGTPTGTDLEAMIGSLETIPGVCNVHDVHVWTVTSGYDVFSGHVIVRRGTDINRVVTEAAALLQRQFGIRHSTIQALEEDPNNQTLNCCGGECPFEPRQEGLS